MKLSWLKYHTRTELLNSINQIDCWGHILGHKVELGQYILNPLRSDTNAGSCYLSEWKGKVVLTDWANYKYSGYDCISAYMALNPHKSWLEVTVALLSIGSYQNYVPAVTKRKKTIDLKPIYKDWTESELKWWSDQGVFKEQMDRKDTLIRPIKGYVHKKEGKEMTVYLSEPAYCYHHKGRYKFYFPTRKENRFLGNQTRDDVWFLDRGTPELLICKCQKDMLGIENACDLTLTHVQGESYGHPNTLTIYEWELKFSHIYIWFDPDDAGQNGAKLLKSKFLYVPCTIINTPPELEAKDASDILYKYGLKYLTDFLKKETKKSNDITISL